MDNNILGGEPEFEQNEPEIENNEPELENNEEIESVKSLEDETAERVSELGNDVTLTVPVSEDTDDTQASADDEQMQVERVDGYPDTPYYDRGAEMCALCGEKPANKEYGEDYDLCDDCRRKLIRSPVRFSGVLAIVVCAVLSLVGLYLLLAQAPVLSAVGEGIQNITEKKYYSAITNLQSVSNGGWKTGRALVNSYYSSGYLGPLRSTVQNYFYDKSSLEEGQKLTWTDKVGKSNLNAPWNKELKKTYTDYEAAMSAYEKYYALFSDYDEQIYYNAIAPDDVPYDDLIKQLEDERDKTESSADLAFISYCEYYLASMCRKDNDIQLEAIERCKQDAPEYDWLYLTPLTEAYIKAGKYDKAEECCKQLETKNAEDNYADYYRAKILRNKKDYDGALRLLETMIEDYDTNGFYLALYESAICNVFKGDFEAAETFAARCYKDQEYLNYTTVNLYALICKELGDEKGYDETVEFLKGYDFLISPTIEKYLKGEVTLEEMFSTDRVFDEAVIVKDDDEKTDEKKDEAKTDDSGKEEKKEDKTEASEPEIKESDTAEVETKEAEPASTKASETKEAENK